MDEKSIIEELVDTETSKEAARVLLAHWETTKVWLERMQKLIKRFCVFMVNAIRRIVANGTRYQRRTAWKLLHPPHKLRRSYRRLKIARRRALDQVATLC